jgi:conjugative relaxase-like TrwC/TraI family protein
MLNIEVNRSAKGVEQYFDCELAVSDYLMKEPGIWAGRGAQRLGLRGPVERAQFVALLRNENPKTGKRLTARMNTSRQKHGERVSNRQVGYGLVFGVPKSLSIYLAITRDQLVENIARSAVDETMCAMEYEMQCKVRKGGLHEDRRTGELLYSRFFHRDSRPISGLSDPHWHVHCFLHNATFDPVEKRWKAGQFRGLIADKGYFQEYFHTLLAQRLMESGYKLRRTDRGWHQWEIACITDREVELFSKRNELIDTLSEERGSTPEEERRIAQHERDSKTTRLFNGAAEIENWRQQMGPQRWDSITPERAKAGPQLELPINPRNARLHPRQGRVASIGDATRRTQVGVGVHPSSARIDAAIQESNNALSLGNAPRGGSSRHGHGALTLGGITAESKSCSPNSSYDKQDAPARLYRAFHSKDVGVYVHTSLPFMSSLLGFLRPF